MYFNLTFQLIIHCTDTHAFQKNFYNFRQLLNITTNNTISVLRYFYNSSFPMEIWI